MSILSGPDGKGKPLHPRIPSKLKAILSHKPVLNNALQEFKPLIEDHPTATCRGLAGEISSGVTTKKSDSY